MKTKFTLIILFQLLFCSISFAQESNFKEDYSSYLPEVRKVNTILKNMISTGSFSYSILTKDGLEKARNGMNSAINPNTIIKPSNKYIQRPNGKIRLAIFKPDTIRGVVLEIHGGGWMQGSPENDAQFNDELARKCNVAVVSVDYRLAPENPFPDCIEDCQIAAKWLLENTKKEFGTEKIFISGGSAGGHLAALTTLYFRDSLHAIDKVKGVNLIYGVYDLGRTPSMRLATDSTWLPKKNMEEIFQLVFGNLNVEQRQHPRYSPLYADLHNLPPALFTIGASDPVADDTYFMEARWRMAGNKTFLAVYPESGHGVDVFSTKLAKISREKMYDWIKELCK